MAQHTIVVVQTRRMGEPAWQSPVSYSPDTAENRRDAGATRDRYTQAGWDSRLVAKNLADGTTTEITETEHVNVTS